MRNLDTPDPKTMCLGHIVREIAYYEALDCLAEAGIISAKNNNVGRRGMDSRRRELNNELDRRELEYKKLGYQKII